MSRFWRHFLTNGHDGRSRAYLGLSGRRVPIPLAVAKEVGVIQMHGLQVSAVKPGSPAADAGILPADVLVTLAEQPATTVAQEQPFFQ